MSSRGLSLPLLALGMSLALCASGTAGTLVATYQFQGSLAADQGGVPGLTAVDPTASNGYETLSVFGHTRQVYNFNGIADPPEKQGGLQFDNSSNLVTANSYSTEMVFQLNQRVNGWRRIIDPFSRQSDSGLYVNTFNHLSLYPDASGLTWTNDVFHHLVTVQSGGHADIYYDGVLALSATSNILEINNPEKVLNFFLDNTAGGGVGEWSKGKIALLKLYDGTLTANEVATLASDPFVGLGVAVPEPSTIASAGFAGMVALVGLIRRRTK